MKKKAYILYIQETNNPKLLKNMIDFFTDTVSEFSSVDLVIKEFKQFKNKNLSELKGLDPWI